nr:hypothetical protein 7 [Desulfobacteraceae bacterium]
MNEGFQLDYDQLEKPVGGEDGPNSDDLTAYPTNEEAVIQHSKALDELGDEAEPLVTAANAMLDAFGDEQLKKDLVDTGYGNDPRLVRELGAVGKDFFKTVAENRPGTGSLAEAQVEAARRRAQDRFQHIISDTRHRFIKKHGPIES